MFMTTKTACFYNKYSRNRNTYQQKSPTCLAVSGILGNFAIRLSSKVSEAINKIAVERSNLALRKTIIFTEAWLSDVLDWINRIERVRI